MNNHFEIKDPIYNIIYNINKYISIKYFNDDYPENHNIRYDKKNKICLIKENNTWGSKDIDSTINMLIEDNIIELANRYNTVKDDKIDVDNIQYYYTIFKYLYKNEYNSIYKNLKKIVKTYKHTILMT